MARQPRTDFPGAHHHIMNRGADHQVIFRNDDDRQLFLTLWSIAVVRFGIVVVSFCLMDNHFHIVVISTQGQLSRVMQFIGRSYTQQFNYHHDRDGALCRGRFHSVLIDSDNYFERVVRYVELNPVVAGICSLEGLENYRWSSFRYYTGTEPTPLWLSTEPVLSRYSDPDLFARFVQSDMGDPELDRFYSKQMRPGLVLGKQEFVESLWPKHGGSTDSLTAGIPAVSIERIEAVVLAISGADGDYLKQSIPGTPNPARKVAADLAHLLNGASMQTLADRYGFLRSSSVSSSIRASRSGDHTPAMELRLDVLRVLGRDSDGLPL